MVAMNFSYSHNHPATRASGVGADSQDTFETASNCSNTSTSSIASTISAIKRKVKLVRKSNKSNETQFVNWDALLDGFRIGGQHEVKSALAVRMHDNLKSDAKAVLKPGTSFKILEFSTNEKRRAKISTHISQDVGIEGWISLATADGELIVGDVSKLKGNNKDSIEFVPKFFKVKQILEASIRGNLTVVRQLSETNGLLPKLSGNSTKPSINCCDIYGKTPLMYAAKYANLQIVEYLLSKTREIEVNALDENQKCALHHAAQRAKSVAVFHHDETQSRIVKLLIHKGAYIEARDCNGCTALMLAVANGDVIVASNLLTAKASVNIRDFEGKNPLDYASTYGQKKLETILRAADAEGKENCEAVLGMQVAVEADVPSHVDASTFSTI